MNKRTAILKDVQLDTEEQEIEDLLPETLEALPVTENLQEEIHLAKEAAANYLRKEVT